MNDGSTDRATQAFRRLLGEGQQGGQAKVDALVALAQRTVYVATWKPRDDGFRTLVNSGGEIALPVFTDEQQLEDAARRFGWVGADGSVASEEIGAREAMRRVVSDRMHFLVVDIAAPYALECMRDELEPLVTGVTRSDSTGPFAAVGRISSTMLEAGRRTSNTPPLMEALTPQLGQPNGAKASDSRTASRPAFEPGRVATPPPMARPATPGPIARPTPGPIARPTPGAIARPGSQQGIPRPPSQQALPATDFQPPQLPPSAFPARPSFADRASARASADTGLHLTPVREEPSEDLLDDLVTRLRDFPEIEWAAYCLAKRETEGEHKPVVGMRVDPQYRQRVNEIATAVLSAGVAHGTVLEVVLLDDAALVREARHEGVLFFPWKRRRSSVP